jgi:succinyl-CoA synthetase alpha subunit/RimJ/RimL family protein N-acetyltransferase
VDSPSDEIEQDVDVLLRDGSTARIRTISPNDAPSVISFHEGLSADSIRLRFFNFHPHLSEREVNRLTHLTGGDDLALVAIRGDDIVAIAQYDRSPESDEAEVGFVVANDYHGRGLSTILLERLAAEARHCGVKRFVAHTLWENQAMRSVLQDAGFSPQFSHDADEVTVVLDIAPSPAAVAAADERDRIAVVHSMARLLQPRSIAVIGASRTPRTIGHELVTNLVDGGFAGPVYPVNPSATAVASLPCWPTIDQVPGEVDLAIVAVPAPAVPDVVAACGRKNVGGLVVISAGFAEFGAEGVTAQNEITRLAHANGMRLVGPNCFGVINTDPAVSMNATFAAHKPFPGGIGFASQSGGLGIAILAEARSRGLGLSSFVSMGNKADVSGNDLLAWWEQDDATRVILLYLESFGNPRKFSRIARRVGRSKPIVAVKSGRSRAGTRAASSHTAALASSEQAVEALFRQTGVVRVDTIEELFDVAAVLVDQPLPTGRRVAIMGNAGGPGVLGRRRMQCLWARCSRAIVRAPGTIAGRTSGLGRIEQPDRPDRLGIGRCLSTLPADSHDQRRGGRCRRHLHAAARNRGRRRRCCHRSCRRRCRHQAQCTGRDGIPGSAIGCRYFALRTPPGPEFRLSGDGRASLSPRRRLRPVARPGPRNHP